MLRDQRGRYPRARVAVPQGRPARRRRRGGAASTSRAAPTIRSGSRPTSRFVPSVRVIGRSVLSRSVRQGTPSTVVSSCTPPESVSTSRADCLQRDEVEVAGRRDDPHPRRRPGAAQLARPPGDGRAAPAGSRGRSRRGPAAARRARPGRPRWPGRCSVTRPYCPGRSPSPASVPPGRGPVGVRQQGVHHDVADQVDLLDPASLGPQVGHRVRGRGEQVVAHPVGDDPVDLLGHRPVAAAQARFHVRQRRARAWRRPARRPAWSSRRRPRPPRRGPVRKPAARRPSSPGRSAPRGCPSPRRGSGPARRMPRSAKNTSLIAGS